MIASSTWEFGAVACVLVDDSRFVSAIRERVRETTAAQGTTRVIDDREVVATTTRVALSKSSSAFFS